ncbi:unnamed protein product [Ectocarpus sp. 8 AP-2014]
MPMPSTSAESVNALTPPRSTFTSGSARAATVTATEASWPRSGESASSSPTQMWMGQPAVATGVPAGYAHPVEPYTALRARPPPPPRPGATSTPTVVFYQAAIVGPPASNVHYEQQDPHQQQQQQEPAETDNLITLSSSPPNN